PPGPPGCSPRFVAGVSVPAGGGGPPPAPPTSYGRLLALLAARCGDVTTAEDALADAFERAVRHWPVDGVPANPDAWLLTVARNRIRDVVAGAPARRTVALDPVRHDPGLLDRIDPEVLEDRRLELLFVCAHPAIDPPARTPLMLNTLLGCTAEQIGRAFSVPTATTAARLTRAKKRIRQARIPFRVPAPAELPARVDAVLEAVYGAFAIDWHTTGRELHESLTGEALHLAEVLTQVLPDDPEAHGLAALIDLCTARIPARIDATGDYIPLERQDRRRWDAELVVRGRAHLRRAYSFATVGRYQLEAAIQAAEGAGADPVVILDLHRALHRFAPTLGSATSLAAATARVHGPAAGLAVLDAEVDDRRFQSAWAVRAHLCRGGGGARAAGPPPHHPHAPGRPQTPPPGPGGGGGAGPAAPDGGGP
ncbi:RNA polymerase sigma factor, partial [Nocardia carnea]|uniref:RNA polymerase sigma factor n=1 Tax=Nocardia carnea TaxID=37328 RepID=UPI0024555534